MKQELTIDPSLLTPADSPTAIKLKSSSLERLTTIRRASAWELARWPHEKYVIWDRARIHLPRSYLSKDGEDIRAVHPGVNINQLVHQHYLEDVGGGEVNGGGVNFVHADRIAAKRHEFLGPDPRVAGYFIDIDGDIHIKWLDGFLCDQWMGSQKWEVEMMWDGEKWVEKMT